MATMVKHMAVRPLSKALGAEVSGIDVSTIDEAAFNTLRDIFHDNLVLVVKDQDLSPAEQTAFARRFGDIQYHISPEYLMKDQPEVMILSNEKEDGKYIGLPDGGSEWHSDHSYVDQPTGYTMLHAIKVPREGEPPHSAGPSRQRSGLLQTVTAGFLSSHRAHPSRDRSEGAVYVAALYHWGQGYG
jgi:taurine dioxygenase